MDHGEHGLAATAADLHSTLEGHVLPGSMFFLWALIWMVQRIGRAEPAAGATLESSAVVPTLKIVLPLIGVWVAIPGERWGPTATLMSLLGAWVLYLSGWELDNPVNEGRSTMIFSWLVMLASAIVVSAWVYSGRRRPLGREVRVG